MSLRSIVRTGSAAVVLASLLAGCGGGKSEGAEASPTSPGGIVVGGAEDWDCGDAEIDRQRTLVFVSTTGSDGNGLNRFACGQSLSSACRTIGNGLQNCPADGASCSVLVQHGLYVEENPVSLKDGVQLTGGCRFGGEADRRLRTVLQHVAGIVSGGTPAIQGLGLRRDTLVQNLVVLGADQTAPGSASLGMAVEFSPGLRLVGTTIVAGRGGDGAAGGPAAAGAGRPGTGAGGEFGQPGGAACTGSSGSTGQGGQGGDGLRAAAQAANPGRLICEYPNGDASVGRSGQASGTVAGGGNGGFRASGGAYCLGAPDVPSADAFDGKNGQDGRPGPCARTGGVRNPDRIGSFGDTFWTASSGGSGSAGEVGSGGGGGNSGGYCISFDGGRPGFISGVGAGGGGGGGCGGLGGAGGQLGGASVALVVVGQAIQRDPRRNVLVPGVAGAGGAGGGGNAGGPGGVGGAGSSAGSTRVGNYACPGPSGRGGNGGQGGAGAGGAGGNGGPSIALALTAGASAPASTQGMYAGLAGSPGGAPGAGGQNASGPCRGADGADSGLAGLGQQIVVY